MSVKTIVKVLLRVTVLCLAGVTNLLHSPDVCAQMCCKISFLSYVSHMKGTCSLIWGVTHSCVTAPWLLFVWGPYFWGWQCCVSACWAVVCPKMLQETCPFWRCFLCRQRGRGVTLFASLCGPAVQSTGRDFLAQWPLCPFL